MVNSKEQARQLIKEVQLKIMDLPVFEEKVDTVRTLIDIEWSLRELEIEDDSENADIWDEELRGGIESPWAD
jgi:hypothetical protein